MNNDKVREALLEKASDDWSSGAVAIGIEEAIEVINNLNNWQPIETAPKTAPMDNGKPTIYGRYMDGEWVCIILRFVDVAVENGYTHWQPLPDPPEKK